MNKIDQVVSESVIEGAGPYSQGLRIGQWLLIAGQVAWDAEGGIVGVGDIETQARQVFQNLRALCEAAGGSLSDIVQLRMFVTDIEDAAVVSRIRRELFTPPFPTATTVAVTALVQSELLVEVEATAYLGSITD